MTGSCIGRAAELGRLTAELERARQGRGGAVAIVGEPGIGKSHLLEAVATLAEARGFRCAWGRAWDGEGVPIYGPFAQLLGALPIADLIARLPPARRADLPLLAQILPELDLGVAQAGADEGRRLAEVVAAVLAAQAREQPLLLLVEDLHAADSASLELLRLLARGFAAERILLLCTSRQAESRQRADVRRVLAELGRQRDELLLGGLDEDGVADLMTQVTGGAPPAGLAALVHRRTEGNPLFVRETSRLLAAHRGGEPRTASELPLADRVTDIIEQRAARLSPAARRALDAAAVLGREFTADALRALLEQPTEETLAAVQQGIDAGLLVAAGPGRFAFTHILYRTAIYRALPLAARGALHLGVARVLEGQLERATPVAGDKPYAELAHHFAAAAAVADVGAQRVRYARLAGEHAAALHAFEDAARNFETALAATSPSHDPAEVLDLSIRLGEARVRAGQGERGREILERAAVLARSRQEGAALARIALLLGRQPTSPLRPDRFLLDLLGDALAGVGDDQPALRARLLARVSAALLFTGDDAERERTGREALALARGAGSEALGPVLVATFYSLWSPDNLDERMAIAAELTRLGEGARDVELELEGRRALMLALLEREGPAAAGPQLDRCQELAERLSDAHVDWLIGLHAAALEVVAGHFTDAERRARRSLALAQEVGLGNEALIHYLMVMGFLRKEQRRLQEIEPLVVGLRAELPTWAGAPHFMLELELDRGDREAAAETFAELARHGFSDIPRDMAWLGTMVALADAAATLEAKIEGAILEDLLAPHADRHAICGRVACYLGPVARVLGRLASARGDHAAAAELLGRAARVAGAAGYPVGVAHAESAAAEAAARHGDDARAAALAASARARYETAQIKVSEPVEPPPRTVVRAPAPAKSALVTLATDGDGWQLGYGARSLRLRDVKGLRYLAALVAKPGRDLHVVQLIAHAGGEPLDLGDAGEKLDARALADYRRRLTDLADALQDAEAQKDRGRADLVQAEIDRLEQELAAAVGLGGRVRRAASAVERMRQSVTKRLRDAIRRVAEKDAELGDHLERSVRTGLFCSYDPVVAVGKG